MPPWTNYELSILRKHANFNQLAYENVMDLAIQRRLCNLGLLFQTGPGAYAITDRGIEVLGAR